MEEKSIMKVREALNTHNKPSAVANMFIKALLVEGYTKSDIKKITHTMETLMLVDDHV